MTVISVVKDPENQKVIITARFEASAERVWRLWSDPIQLERWWGPPAQLMTVVEHDLKPGGRVSYFVTGSDSHRTYGWWDVRTVEPPHRLDFDLGDARIPTVAVRVEIYERGGTAFMTIESTLPSAEAMATLLGMGFDRGMATAVGQIDAVLHIDRGTGSL